MNYFEVVGFSLKYIQYRLHDTVPISVRVYGKLIPHSHNILQIYMHGTLL